MAERNFPGKAMWTGDCLYILRGMNSASVDLIYLDPPFNSNADYAAPIGSQAAGAAFTDTWTLSDLDVEWINLIEARYPALNRALLAAMTPSDKSYLVYMAARLLEMKRVLKPNGSVYLHCDQTMAHYLKVLMDAIFGKRNFCNNIAWSYRRWTSAAHQFQRMHDDILFYALPDATFNEQSEDMNRKSQYFREWRHSLGDVFYIEQDIKESDSRPETMSDVWEISVLNSQAKERVGYPTQKPLALLDRIIRASSNEGDVVLDPFCGCATTCVAADDLGARLDRH